MVLYEHPLPYASGFEALFLKPSGAGFFKYSVLDCIYIVPDYLIFGYTFSVNTFQQVFNRKFVDFSIILTSNVQYCLTFLYMVTEKSNFLCGKVFTLDEQCLKRFLFP